tara:strand:+ start:80 stop:997 length:918 start_codon:yes stop_codon:yes gene_type:complete
MPLYTKDAGYGRTLVNKLGLVTNGMGGGKNFVVGKSALAYSSMYRQLFNPDADGTVRYFATITAALGACTAAGNDTIYVLPGHTEDIIGAAGITASVSGVSIVGLGTGRLRPTLTWKTSTAAQIVVSGANTTWQNFVFDLTGISAVIAAFSVTAADVSFLDNEFIISTGTNAPVLGILTAATAARLKVLRNKFIGPATSTDTCTACIQHEVGEDYEINDNYFTGKLTQAVLNATTLLRGQISRNFFVIATGTKAIAMAAASTPFISNNRINVPSGTAPIVAAAGFVAGNVYSAAAGVTAGTASTI